MTACINVCVLEGGCRCACLCLRAVNFPQEKTISCLISSSGCVTVVSHDSSSWNWKAGRWNMTHRYFWGKENFVMLSIESLALGHVRNQSGNGESHCHSFYGGFSFAINRNTAIALCVKAASSIRA